uniref:Uncharacterized protein n=1 Tax=Arundo donax TaxID=35708 RepID=A0A0A9A5S6_ARUDO
MLRYQKDPNSAPPHRSVQSHLAGQISGDSTSSAGATDINRGWLIHEQPCSQQQENCILPRQILVEQLLCAHTET